MNEERVRRFLALAASGNEVEEADRILQVAFYRRAVYEAYRRARFTEAQAMRLLVAELAAPTIYASGDDTQ